MPTKEYKVAVLDDYQKCGASERRLVGAAELERMKPTARLINAARGPIVKEQALITVLKNKQIAGVEIDVFHIEQLPPSHPFRALDNVLAPPHIGYVLHDLYKTFYEDTVTDIRKWLDNQLNSAITGKETMPTSSCAQPSLRRAIQRAPCS